jgi:hypothetical protein
MKVLRYILFLLIVGLYASPLISIQEDASSQPECTSCASVILNDLSNDYAKRLQLQYDWTDALTSSQFNISNQENRVRSRRHERISSSWQLSIPVHLLHATLKRQEIGISHSINQIVALSHIMPLNLPTEQISFPFHSFW